MSKLKIERCPETGICSIVRDTQSKVDLMPDEVLNIKDTGGSLEKIRAVIAESDADFAKGLSDEDLGQIAKRLVR